MNRFFTPHNHLLRLGGEGGASSENSEDDAELHRSSSSSSLLETIIAFDRGIDKVLGMALVEEQDGRPNDSLLLPPGIFLDSEKRGLNMLGKCIVLTEHNFVMEME